MPIDLNFSQHAILVCALTFNNKKYVDQSSNSLQNSWGKILLDSKPYSFSGMNYYAKEMGNGLLKKLIVFETHIPLYSLYEKKLYAIKIEKQLATKTSETEMKRNINIDPGLLTSGSLVLSSTKYSPHRIPIGPGIFAETTLLYEKGIYKPLPWTYLDYKNELVQETLLRARSWLKKDRKISINPS